MNTTTRTLIAIPLAAAALSAGTTAAMAQPAGPVVSDLDIIQPDPNPDPDPGPQFPGDKDGPNNDPGPDDGPQDEKVPDDRDDDDRDDNDDDRDDSDDDDRDDSDDDDRDDSDDDDGGKKVRRPTRVDAGATEDGLSFAWLLASGAMVTAAGGFTARRVALKQR